MTEKQLVADCLAAAKAMNAYVEVAGQRDARGSGSTIGLPDAFLYCAGKCLPVEFKTPKGRLSPGQTLAQHKRADQHVHTFIVRTVAEFCDLINGARRFA